jgi:hypothetical protein
MLLLTFEVIISIGIYELIEEHIPTEYLIHYFGIMSLIPVIIANEKPNGAVENKVPSAETNASPTSVRTFMCYFPA